MNSFAAASHSVPVEPGTLASDFASWPIAEATQQFPFAYYAALHRHAPVYRYPRPDERTPENFMVTGWEEVAQVLTDASTFSVDLSGVLPAWEGMATQPGPCPHLESSHGPRSVFFSEGDDHRVKRNWALRFVERSRLAQYRPQVAQEADRLIDSVAAAGACDFRPAFADRLPTMVLAAVLGLDGDAAARIRGWSDIEAATSLNPTPTVEQSAAREQALAESGAFYLELLEARRASPGEDYVSELVVTQLAQDGTFDPNALAVHLRVLLFGGDHAMGTLLADLAINLAQHADVQQRLRDDPGRIPQFVRETLRLDAPVPVLVRRAATDTTLGGVDIPADSVVSVALAAGNRDPREFEDPERLDLDRPNTQRNQLALGRGAHRCAGAPLAQMEGEVAVERLLARLGDIRLDVAKSDLTPDALFCAGFRVPSTVHLTYRALA